MTAPANSEPRDVEFRAPGSAQHTPLHLLTRGRQLAPPVRIVHIGLGAFHRSHQAWFTHHATDAAEWGIAAFTGRRPGAAHTLAMQDGLFTLVVRGPEGDRFEILKCITEAHSGADTHRLDELLAAPTTAVVTLTITEAAYQADDPDSPLARLVGGLAARRASSAGPLAVVSCDNVASNGDVTRDAVLRIAEAWDTTTKNGPLAPWIRDNVSFVNTSVDRITPRTTDADIAEVQSRCGYQDRAVVVAEPFANWILSGDFPAGRPAWEAAGAQFVDGIEPFENRKLWLLNGAHSLLAYAGSLRGHSTVSDALADPLCRNAVEAFWDEAQRHLTASELDIPSYRASLLNRFSNPRITHYLEQISADGTTKLRMRAVPVLAAERRAGRSGLAAAVMLAAWVDFVSANSSFQDPMREQILAALALEGRERTSSLLALLDPLLAEDEDLTYRVDSLLGSFAPN
ncbi:mannitol dehydrogenase family protein [Arthrobacter sp. MAHUQ-56]